MDIGERTGFSSANADYPPSYRDNDRLVIDDPNLAERLFVHLIDIKAECDEVADMMDMPDWTPIRINERIRFCRYRPGTQFGPHQDGVHFTPCGQSHLTFMVYLNDSVFDGGDTVFFESRSDAMHGGEPIARVRPKKGSLVMFDHDLWHAGSRVEAGVKYVLRSDLVYTRRHAHSCAPNTEPGHKGYIWALCPLSDGRIVSMGRDTSLRLWDADGRPLAHLVGHTQSVLGAFQIENESLVSFSRDRSIRTWHLSTGRSEVLGCTDAAVLSGARLGEEKIVTGDAKGILAVWNLNDRSSMQWQAHSGWLWDLAIDNTRRIFTVAEDGWLKAWLAEKANEIAAIDLRSPLRSIDACNCASGVRLAIGDAEGTVRLFLAGKEFVEIGTIDAHQGAILRVRFEDETTLLSCGEDGRVCRWNLCSLDGTVLCVHTNFATDVHRINDGRWLSCGYDGHIRAIHTNRDQSFHPR